jgi:hypothetical protein
LKRIASPVIPLNSGFVKFFERSNTSVYSFGKTNGKSISIINTVEKALMRQPEANLPTEAAFGRTKIRRLAATAAEFKRMRNMRMNRPQSQLLYRIRNSGTLASDGKKSKMFLKMSEPRSGCLLTS